MGRKYELLFERLFQKLASTDSKKLNYEFISEWMDRAYKLGYWQAEKDHRPDDPIVSDEAPPDWSPERWGKIKDKY